MKNVMKMLVIALVLTVLVSGAKASLVEVLNEDFESSPWTGSGSAAGVDPKWTAGTGWSQVNSPSAPHMGSVSLIQSAGATGSNISRSLSDVAFTDTMQVAYTCWSWDNTGSDATTTTAYLERTDGTAYVQVWVRYSDHAILVLNPAADGWLYTGATLGFNRPQDFIMDLDFTTQQFSLSLKDLNAGTTAALGTYSFSRGGSSLASANGNFKLYARKAYFDNLRIATVPEPATIAVLGLGGLLFARRKRS